MCIDLLLMSYLIINSSLILNNYIKMFKEEGDVVIKMHRKTNIGIFEFNQELF